MEIVIKPGIFPEERGGSVAQGDTCNPMKNITEVQHIAPPERSNGVHRMRNLVGVVRILDQGHPRDIVVVIEFKEML